MAIRSRCGGVRSEENKSRYGGSQNTGTSPRSRLADIAMHLAMQAEAAF
jgi:hypothetical protein